MKKKEEKKKRGAQPGNTNGKKEKTLQATFITRVDEPIKIAVDKFCSKKKIKTSNWLREAISEKMARDKIKC